MAKKRNTTSKPTTSPSTLTMKLFDPGMTAMHRAGLGGLACSLRYIEDNARTMLDDQLPGGPWENHQPPWTVETDEITLDFGTPQEAGEFLRRLFKISFQIVGSSKTICLPGQYQQPVSLDALADAQAGLMLTFLPHNKARKLDDSIEIQIDAEGDGSRLVNATTRPCNWYVHQEGWKTIVAANGTILNQPMKIVGALSPGTIIRHDEFKKNSTMKDPASRMLPLYFALVGTLALPINRGVGVLIVPEVDDLVSFQVLRPLMSPRNARECKIAGASDAALQCQLRLKAAKELAVARIPACTAILFRSTAWARQLKSRVDAIEIPRGDENTLRVFEHAVQQFAPRVITTVSPKAKSQAKKSKVVKKSKPTGTNEIASPQHFWSDSIVRPLIADNLARGQPWYKGFYDLMTKLDPVSKKPIRLRLSFEKVGLKNMIDKIDWNDTGEKAIVLAVHQAIKQRLGQIASENKGKQGVMKNRMKGEFEKWRLAFSGSKTADQFRQSLCDLFGRAGINPVLKEHWLSILPWLSSPIKWQLARDLSLLALASYTGTGAKEIEPSEDSQNATDES